MTWKVLSKKTLIKNEFFTLEEERCRKHNGEIAEKYYSMKKPDSVVIVAITKTKKIILIQQYRHPIRSTKYEVPAGYVEKTDKNFIESAKRELLEETGYKPKKLIKLGKTFALSGFLTNTVHFFLALDCEKIDTQHLDKDEEIDVKETTLKIVLTLVNKSDIMDMGSVTAILMAKEYITKHKLI